MRPWLFAFAAALAAALAREAAIAQTAPVWPDETADIQVRPAQADAPWFAAGPVEVAPSLDLSGGWNSDADGDGHASGTGTIGISAAARDNITGTAMLLGVTATHDPSWPSADSDGWDAGVDQHWMAGESDISLAAGYVHETETALDLAAGTITGPLAVSIGRVRAEATIPLAGVSIVPTLSVTRIAVPGAPFENATLARQGAVITTADGGALRVRLTLGETEAAYEAAALSSDDTAAAVGIRYQPGPIWRLDAGIGAARRARAGAAPSVAPIAEAALSWSPTRADRLVLSAFHDPADPTNAGGAADSETRIGAEFRHDLPRDISLVLDLSDDMVRYRGAPGPQSLLNAGITARLAMGGIAAIELSDLWQRRSGGGVAARASEQITIGAVWPP